MYVNILYSMAKWSTEIKWLSSLVIITLFFIFKRNTFYFALLLHKSNTIFWKLAVQSSPYLGNEPRLKADFLNICLWYYTIFIRPIAICWNSELLDSGRGWLWSSSGGHMTVHLASGCIHVAGQKTLKLCTTEIV